MNDVLIYLFSASFFSAILRVTTPILFATLGSVLAERAGTPNICLEAIMLFAALGGALGSSYSGSVIFGFLIGVLAGLLISATLAFFSLRLRANIILAGIALNLLAVGGTVFIMYTLIGDKGSTSSIVTHIFPRLNIPLLENIPVLGNLLNNHNVLTYLAFFLVWFTWLLLFRTRLGVRIRAVGANAPAAESVGINVIQTQVIALMLSGLFASFGGAFMSMGYMHGFSQNMIAGRGFIALAAASMGQRHPVAAMFAAFLFGLSDAISNVLASLRIPDEFVKMIPYIVTILALVAFSIISQKRKQARQQRALDRKTA